MLADMICFSNIDISLFRQVSFSSKPECPENSDVPVLDVEKIVKKLDVKYDIRYNCFELKSSF